MKKFLPIIIFIFCFSIFAYPDNKGAEKYLAAGIAKVELGDYTGAIEDCSKAIEHNPKLAAAYYSRGLAKPASVISNS